MKFVVRANLKANLFQKANLCFKHLNCLFYSSVYVGAWLVWELVTAEQLAYIFKFLFAG